jgi:protoheme IX farnesyltransferase
MSSAVLASPAAVDRRQAWKAYLELGKIRLSSLVVFTTAVGYIMAPGDKTWIAFIVTVLGTTLAALGANALNQWLEVERDALMARTRTRPLPAGELTAAAALLFGIVTGTLGPLLLTAVVGWAAGALALLTLLIYVLMYTPLKTRSPVNTLVGAVVGALPPLIGWVAAAGQIHEPAWLIAGILFVWQIPHFLSLAWMKREEYARSGFRMLPVVDPAGHLTACIVAVYAALLIPLAVMVTLVGLCGWVFAVGGVLLGLGMLACSVVMEHRRSEANARRVFLASLAYLPLVLGLMMLDRAGGWL